MIKKITTPQASKEMNQNHLKKRETINLGSYYTPEKYILKCYEFLQKNIKNLKEYSILDSSCGYGNFLNKNYFTELFSSNQNFSNTNSNTNSSLNLPKQFIGADIDRKAIEIAVKKSQEEKLNFNTKYFHCNSLSSVNRKNYDLSSKEKIIIIGNPPYNDKTSLIRQNIKKNDTLNDILNHTLIDKEIQTRDLGMSFLLSYAKLQADYICVLHPLSYLIKQSNFKILKKFTTNYQLKEATIFNSQEFNQTSKITGFPIVIGFYQKSKQGMDYNFIKNYPFKTIEDKVFKINHYEYIDKFITKYPNQKNISIEKTFAYFWTMRDINALKRSRTFIEKESSNAIRIPKEKMSYYCYVDVFKKFISNIPYYFGNSNIMIDFKEYEKVRKEINLYSIATNPILKKKIPLSKKVDKKIDLIHLEKKITNYFKNLFKEHYVY